MEWRGVDRQWGGQEWHEYACLKASGKGSWAEMNATEENRNQRAESLPIRIRYSSHHRRATLKSILPMFFKDISKTFQ